MADDGAVDVRYLVDDVGAATAFSVEQLGFELHWSRGGAFAEIARQHRVGRCADGRK